MNDSGIEGGGTENRIRLLVDDFLKDNSIEEIHILQSSKTKARDSGEKVIFHFSSGNKKEAHRETRNIITDNNIDLVQAHNLLVLSMGGLRAARDLKIPIAWFAHDYWSICSKRSFIDPYNASKNRLCSRTNILKCITCSGIKTWLRLKLFQHMLNYAKLAIASCDFVKNVYEKHGILRGKWQVISPWLNLSNFLPHGNYEHRDNSIIFTGSLLEYKGAWILAEAFVKVSNEYPQAILKFIGSEQEPGNEYRIRILNKVKFLGPKNWEELSKIYKNASIYVCPTVCMETFGLNWAEAMASGCPVIASNIGSLPEFLNNRSILVPPRDSEKLAEAIIFMLKNPAYAKKLCEDGIKYANNAFSVSRASKEILALYKKLGVKG